MPVLALHKIAGSTEGVSILPYIVSDPADLIGAENRPNEIERAVWVAVPRTRGDEPAPG